MCYSDLPYLYVGRGFAELDWPYSDSTPGARPLRRHGVPRRDRLLRLGAAYAHALAERVTRHRRRAARCRRASCTPTRMLRESLLLTAVNAVGFGVCALLAAWLLTGVNRRRPWDAALFAASPLLLLRGPDQLGPARGGLRGRRAVGARPRPTRADRRADRARHGAEALPAVPARRDSLVIWRAPAPLARPRPRSPRSARRPGPWSTRRRTSSGTHEWNGVLDLQRPARRRPRLGLAGRPAMFHTTYAPHTINVVSWVVFGAVVRGRRRARLPGAADAAAGPAGLPGRGRLPAGEQGLLAAVRPVAAARWRCWPGRAGATS